MENEGKNTSILVYIIIVLALLIVGVWMSYFVFYRPSANISASYLEVFQEVEKENVSNLVIDCVDHKVIILPSSDDKIKITYFQKQDNSITYTASGNTVSLKMVERSEDLDNLFYQSKRKLDTITIYVPECPGLSIRVNSVDGSLKADDIKVRSLSFTSVNGACSVSYLTAGKLSLVSNYGNITLANSHVDDISLSQVTGTTEVSLLDSVNDYKVNASSN